MGESRTVQVSHLGGIQASYRLSVPFNHKKPTLVLINSFLTASALYSPQFSSHQLTDVLNLLAIEPLGHGKTQLLGSSSFTYWNSAMMNLQVLDKLGIEKAYVLGTSQGGWIATRMAVLRPEKVLGLILLGTSMDSESDRSRNLGCWDAPSELTPVINLLSSLMTMPSWDIPQKLCDNVVDSGFGANCATETRQFWTRHLRDTYSSNEGILKLRQSTINLRDRVGLHSRLEDITCPVLRMQGDKDVVYTVANAKYESKLFTSTDVHCVEVKGGSHFLSWTNPIEVEQAVLKFISNIQKTRASL